MFSLPCLTVFITQCSSQIAMTEVSKRILKKEMSVSHNCIMKRASRPRIQKYFLLISQYFTERSVTLLFFNSVFLNILFSVSDVNCKHFLSDCKLLERHFVLSQFTQCAQLFTEAHWYCDAVLKEQPYVFLMLESVKVHLIHICKKKSCSE